MKMKKSLLSPCKKTDVDTFRDDKKEHLPFVWCTYDQGGPLRSFFLRRAPYSEIWKVLLIERVSKLYTNTTTKFAENLKEKGIRGKFELQLFTCMEKVFPDTNVKESPIQKVVLENSISTKAAVKEGKF